ncbi:hypothetical protein [Segniliparus rugosus]|uniref:Competence protein CoiA-like family protein n=1 Tax=Segniliparus rugosus (strain ATCC BAA-974 / DSM 45345 / CCUG 50838 / CIP 108380 / JCM 13579 / CDC 945) TaxID=679197 RepID=U1N5J4_SEGRC|nr:hypothetical protein [Segniliparus rugosus]ERG69409.1 hypothetical protein HMPREF9336_04105 [Segniliparus rugosus ATCC BAA-974]
MRAEQRLRRGAAASKQLARLRGSPPGSRALWVYDERDWAVMRAQPSGALICPEPGCGSPFTVVRENQFGTRWLADRPGEDCPHAPTRPGAGGGPMSAQHRWMQERLRRICAVLGQDSIPEHRETNADLYVPGARLVIEVQRWATDFRGRTEARERVGARVLWLITEDASGRSVERALRRQPCVRVRVHERGDRRARLEPWLRPEEASRAVLSFGARVAHFDAAAGGLRLGWRDGSAFLAEVIEGSRVWLPGSAPQLAGLRSAAGPGGAWVLRRDLDRLAEASPRPARNTLVRIAERMRGNLHGRHFGLRRNRARQALRAGLPARAADRSGAARGA